MDKKIIKSFFFRATLATLFLLSVGALTIVYYMQEDFESYLSQKMGEYISETKAKYTLSLKTEYENNKEMLEEDARGLMREMEFMLLELYDENHEEVLELTSKSKRFTEMLNDIQKNHDDLIIHSFPKGEELLYNFFQIENNAYIQIFYPVINNGEKIGYVEGISHVKPIVVEQFKRGLYATLLAIFGSTTLLTAIIFPLVYIAYKQLQAKRQELLYSNIQIIRSLGNAVAQRDSDTDEHNYRVTLYCISLGESLGLEESEMRRLIKGSFLHDVGKIGISDAILLKPGKLNDEEFEIMKTHVSKGSQIVEDIEWLEGSDDIIKYHHEKFDGSGYTNGLKGDEIPLVARIFCIVDVFDALTSKRPYKEPFSFERAMEILLNESGGHFDPKIVEVFQVVIKELYMDVKEKNSAELKSALFEKIHKYFH